LHGSFELWPLERAVLLDVLAVLVQVVGPQLNHVLDRSITVTIPRLQGQHEQPFARQYFAEDILVDAPSGKYRFLVSFQRGAAAETQRRGQGGVDLQMEIEVTLEQVATGARKPSNSTGRT
jgi:hypothetical protein